MDKGMCFVYIFLSLVKRITKQFLPHLRGLRNYLLSPFLFTIVAYAFRFSVETGIEKGLSRAFFVGKERWRYLISNLLTTLYYLLWLIR